MKQFHISRYSFLFLILLISVIYFLRVIHLDQDLPPWGIGYYQPVDEGSYALPALNYIHYGTLNPSKVPGSEYTTNTPLQTRTNIIGNLLSIFGLKILGNNYYGFRFGYVLLGFANIVLYMFILCKMKFDHTGKKHIDKYMVIFIFLLLFDFMFYLCSRTVENSSVRLFFNLLIVYIWISKRNNYKSRFFLISFIAVLSVFLVYITNIFSVLAVSLCIINILLRKDKKRAFQATIYAFLGGIFALIISKV
ncbi:MAG: hypothetical protein NC548_40585, partial [Lachnospiraceae bacterium]|nr:hypothetical protein [Lachnospiraceae bacterium]